LFKQSLELHNELGDRRGAGANLQSLGSVALATGDLEAARAFYARSLDAYVEVGDKRNIGLCSQRLAEMQ
jgi:hypothetical protein